jgi:hypothetical protein
MDCILTIIQKLSEPNLSYFDNGPCSSINQVREGPEDVEFISVMTDQSNHQHTKLVTILVHNTVPQHEAKAVPVLN